MCGWDLLKGEVTEVAGNVPDLLDLVKIFHGQTARESSSIHRFHKKSAQIAAPPIPLP